MRVLGVDPGLANMGLAVVSLEGSSESVVHVEVITTEKSSKKTDVRQSSDLVRRGRLISAGVASVVSAYCPVVIAVEAMSFPRNASSAAKTALSWGVLCFVSETYNIPMVQASPQEIKKVLCGTAKASKKEVQESLERRYSGAFLSFLARYPKVRHEHGFDAVGAVVACLDSECIRMARGLNNEGHE